MIFDTMGFTPADDNIKNSKHGQNVTNEYVAEKIQVLSLQWTVDKQLVVNQQLKMH